jgi:transcriptional regulator with XRE-family HTH domain
MTDPIDDIRAIQELLTKAIAEHPTLSQAKIAEALGLNPPAISMALNTDKQPKPETLNRIAQVLGLSVRVVILEGKGRK